MTRRWVETLEHIVACDGLVVAVELITDPDTHRRIVLVATSDGHRGEHALPEAGGDRLSAFQAWFGPYLEQLAPGRLVALCTVLPNWAGQPIAEVHPVAPNVVLPLRVAPTHLQEALTAHRDELLARSLTRRALNIGTDASVHRQRFGGATWAWVDTNGAYRTYRSPHLISVHAAETLAIICAAQRHSARMPLLIHSDSQNAIANLNDLTSGALSPTALIHRLEIPFDAFALKKRIHWAHRELPDRPVKIQWVKGHAGHPLNEAAHRLATLARRVVVSNCTPSVVEHMCQGVVMDLRDQLDQAS